VQLPFSKELRKHAVEMLVIILGILIAFQVEEWREGLQQERDLQASLVRLTEETEYNLDLCSRSIPNAIRKANEALTVLSAVQVGQLHPESVGQFESGLRNMAALYRPPYISTVAEEMIATGVLRELENPELRIGVAGLQHMVQRVANDYSDQRQALNITMNELARRVEFRYQGSFDIETIRARGSASRIDDFEGAIDVNYDFDALVGDPYFRNLLIETADTFGDLYAAQRALCDATEEVATLLEVSGAH
jgi:hypothetical protein